jgi:hypothetical protein
MSYGDRFVLTLFTNDPELARRADRAGVNRIGLDLEKPGKHERQGHLRAWISNHKPEDIHALRPAVQDGECFARVNPIESCPTRDTIRCLPVHVNGA